MTIRRDRPAELLAPAGSFESVKAAVHAGADAVYMGGRKFGARAFAESAQAEEEDMVMAAIRYCHLFSVRLYMTINVLFKDSELKELFSYIKPYYEAGVDGVIVQDTGAAGKLAEWFPDLELHASTQMTITSTAGAVLAGRLGMCRAVLARELSLQEIRKIHEESGMELEVFVHGAMCYCYSGACFMSSLLGGRSGNRGRCAGTCRLQYENEGQKGYFLSMKDMQTLEQLPALLAAGAYSLKIEGRMKSPVYTAGVVSVYRKYLDLALTDPEHYRVEQRDLQILKEIYDRGGTTSYLEKHNGADMVVLQEKEFRTVNEEILQEITEKYVRRDRQLSLDAEFRLQPGELPALTLRDVQEQQTLTVYGAEPALEATGRPVSRAELEERMRKTGGTPFQIRELQIQAADNVFLPVGQLNELRRDALNQFAEARIEKRKRVYTEKGKIPV